MMLGSHPKTDLLLNLFGLEVLEGVESRRVLLVFLLERLDALLLGLVVVVFALVVLLKRLLLLVKVVLFVVVLVFEGEEVLVQRDVVPEEGLVARDFVFLFDFAVFQKFYLKFVASDLLLQVLDQVNFNFAGQGLVRLFCATRFLLVVLLFQVGTTFELLVARDRAVLVAQVATSEGDGLSAALATLSADAAYKKGGG